MTATPDERREHEMLVQLIAACPRNAREARRIAAEVMPDYEDTWRDRWRLRIEATLRMVRIECRVRERARATGAWSLGDGAPSGSRPSLPSP